MLQAKEGGVILRGGLRFFSLSVSGFTLGGAEPRPTEVFPLVKRSFYLVYHSFC